jgi:SAM-dependent methyltransferase
MAEKTHFQFQRFLIDWFMSPVGLKLLHQERVLVERELAKYFGYYLVQIGHVSKQSLLQTSRIKTKLVIDNDLKFGSEDLQVQADLDFLPFKSDSIDVIVMPHSLETVADPYHLVRQVDGMLMSQGVLVITGFNRWGCSVLRSRLGRSEMAQANLMSMHRIIDWLNLLGYEIKVAQHGPISCFGQKKGKLSSWFWSKIEWLEHGLNRFGWHLGNVYIIVAKKRDVSPTPVGLNWKLANWLPVGKGQTALVRKQNKSLSRFVSDDS